MKLSIALALTFFSVVKATTFSPARISYGDLRDRKGGTSSSDVLLNALRQVGMVSITNIPSFRPIKLETLKSLPDCIQKSSDVATHIFPDGTLRQTIATHTLAGDMQTMKHYSTNNSACQALDQVSDTFREVVADVTNAFAIHLAAALDLDDDTPVLSSQERSFSLKDVVQQGEHLEHFHSYQASMEDYDQDNVDTIEWHIDQGMALVFTPGLLAKTGEISQGFHVKLADGSTAMVDFEEQDDLVILLGDGINQYINGALKIKDHLRALPHALRVPKTDQPRVWYGLMMLPPPDALHPVYQETFADLRHSMMFEEHSGSLALGCSSSMQARELNDITCEDNTFFCWHRCFNYTADASPDVCESQGLDLACVNDERQLWIGDHNENFYPGCVNLATAKNYTAPTNHSEHNNKGAGDTSASIIAGMSGIVGSLVVALSLF